MDKFRISYLPEVEHRDDKGSVNAQIVDLTAVDLHNFIQQNAWAPGIFKNNYRVKKNFEYCNVIAIDIDENLSFFHAKERLERLGIKFSITFSKHHQKLKIRNEIIKPACDRFRIIIFLNKPIKNQNEYDNAINKIHLYLFPELDTQCKDSSRYYKASNSDFNKGQCILNLEGNFYCSQKDYPRIMIQRICNLQNISEKIKYFLNNAYQVAQESRWNEHYNSTVFVLATLDFPQEDILSMLEYIAPSPLDKKDMSTFYAAYASGQVKKKVKKDSKNKFESLFHFLEISLDKIHLFASIEGFRKILKENDEREVYYYSKEGLTTDITNLLANNDLFKSIQETNNLTTYFLSRKTTLAAEPSLVSFTNEPILSFVKVSPPSEEGDCPLFKEFLSRCTNADSLAAFIYSIFIMESNLQQYLYLYGEGQDGKGSLIRFLQALLKNVFCSEIAVEIEKDKHYAAAFLGKRLVAYPDNSIKKLPTNDLFKMITGGDAVKINQKYQHPFTAKLPIKIIICANTLPTFSSQKSDQRRAIICKVKSFTGLPLNNYDELLLKEAPQILHYCKSCYFKMTKNHSPINITNNHAIEIAETSEESFQAIFDELFKLEQSSTLFPKDFSMKLMKLCKEFQINYSNFIDWLTRLDGVTYYDKRPRYFQGIKLKSCYQPNHPFSNYSTYSNEGENDEI